MDAAFDAQMLGHAAAVRAEDAGGVGFVDHQHRVMPLGQLGQFGQRRQIAVHAEQRIGDDQAAAVARGIAEQFGQMIDVGVAVDAHFGPREPAAVDQAGVIFGVGVDRVAAPDQGGDRAEVGGEAGSENQRGLGAFELGQPRSSSACEAEWPVTSGLAPAPKPSCWAALAAAAARRGSAARPR